MSEQVATPPPNDRPAALMSLQFTTGPTVTAEACTSLLHLVPTATGGDPIGHATLCDEEYYESGGYMLGMGVILDEFVPCPSCLARAREDYPGLPVAGVAPFAQPLADALGVPAEVL